MRSGIIKSTYEDTYVFPPPPEYKFLQFGGTGNETIGDIHVLSDGNYLIAITTTSQSFCGLDLSAYTDGSTYYAQGLIKIDPNLPPTGFILGSYWLSGASGKAIGGEQMRAPKIAIDGSDNIYFTYGTYSGTSADIRVYKVRASDMTLQATSNQYLGENYGWQCYYFSQLQVEGSYVYASYSIFRPGYWNKPAVSKFNVSNLSFVSGTVLEFAGAHLHSHVIDTDDYMYHLVLGNLTKHKKSDWSYVNVTSFPAGPSSWTPATMSHETNNIYTALLNDYSGRRRCQVYAHKKDLSGYKTGWSTQYAATEPDNTTVDLPIVLKDNVSEYLMLAWSTSKNAIGTMEISWTQINPANGARISEAWVTYNDGNRIAYDVSKTWYARQLRRYDTDKYLLVGSTSSNLTGFSNSGGLDCIIMKVDHTGKILA